MAKAIEKKSRYARLKIWLKNTYKRYHSRLIVLSLILFFAFLLLMPKIFIVIQSGERGILFRFFSGTDISKVYGEGLNIIAPVNKIIIYNVRLQQETRTIKVLSQDGLVISVEFSIRFRPHIESLPQLHKRLGPDYLEKVILPEFGGAIREVMSQYRPDELYAIDRRVIQREIINLALTQIGEKYLIIDDFLILTVELPAMVTSSIERKLSQEQLAYEYKYRVEVAKLEAQRKLIEAKGIKDFQEMVSHGISPSYLQWRGIEATLELARSNNAKVVVVGGGKSGLPLILNLDSVNGKEKGHESMSNVVDDAGDISATLDATIPTTLEEKGTNNPLP